MRNAALAAVVAASVLASGYVGYVAHGRTSATDANLCLTDQAIVETLESALAQTTAADVHRFYGPARWEASRTKTIERINRFRDISPCAFKVTIPPDVLK